MADEVFIRADLNETGQTMTAYRLPRDLRDFLNRVRERHGKIEAIVLEVDEDSDQYGWNIVFAIPQPKAEKQKPQDVQVAGL